MLRLAEWRDMEGFFVGHESAWDTDENSGETPDPVSVTLRRVHWLDALLDRPTRTMHLGDAVLEVLDGDGHVMGDYSIWDTGVTLSEGSPDAGLRGYVGSLPHARAEWVWDTRRPGRPAVPNGWAALPVGDREAWVEVSLMIHFRRILLTYPVLPEELQLDGRHVEDLASFFCALGEAVNGPGGYCGANLAGMSDFLQYASRPVAKRSRLVWREMAVAEQSLALGVDVDGRPTRYLDVLVTQLAQDGIDVVPG
jgi:hypothetical protein